jgi:endonuclease/exonuclease/phosphatase family metal-dependent hydrolase
MPLSVMTWNVENLFPKGPGDPQDEVDLYQAKLDLLAGTIIVLDPDVVALQEVGAGALADLQGRLPTYGHTHEGDPDGRGIRVGILSRLAFQGNAVDITNFTGPPPIDSIDGVDDGGNLVQIGAMGRGAVRATVVSGNLTVHIITCHLKSKLLTFPGGFFSTNDEDLRARIGAVALMRRTAEAAQIRLEANRLLVDHPGDGVIVLGDLNDGPEAATSQLLLGPPGSEIGTMGFDRPDQGDAARLFNTDVLIDPARRFSRIHRGVGELLDQILASEELFPRTSGVIRDLPTVDSHVDFANQLPSVSSNPNARATEIEPDHAPVTAEFPV